jgi:hypothetical protein
MNKTSCKFILVVLGLLIYTGQASAQQPNPQHASTQPIPQQPAPQFESKSGIYQLTLAGAEHFADLPLRCMQREFPYKTGVAFPDSTLAVKPREYHPAFYGCYDGKYRRRAEDLCNEG